MATLRDKAAEFERLIEEHFLDPDGLLYSGINSDTLRPWRLEDFPPRSSLENRALFESVGWPTLDGFANYENNPYSRFQAIPLFRVF